MIKTLVCMAFAAGMFLQSCQSNKEVGTVKTEEVKATPQTYSLVVSFFSPGNGIDHKMKNRFLEFLSSHSKEISFEIAHWGKEGEIDYCIPLSELNPQEKEVFIEQIKELVAPSSRVRIFESAPCKHKKEL